MDPRRPIASGSGRRLLFLIAHNATRHESIEIKRCVSRAVRSGTDTQHFYLGNVSSLHGNRAAGISNELKMQDPFP
jgi:hypothetical protein